MANNVQITEEQQNTQLCLFIEKQSYSPEDLENISSYILEQLKQKIYKKFDKEATIAKIIDEKRFDEKIVLIQGKLPLEAKDGQVNYTFTQKDKTFDHFKDVLKDEKYLDPSALFTVTTKWAVLANVTEPTKGADGIDIFDNVLKPKAYEGKPAVLPMGKNIYATQKKDQLIAASDGIVYFDENNNIAIGPLITINQITEKEINVEGSLFINCKELPRDLKIKATGSILTKGNIAHGEIEAGGHVVTTGGFNHETKVTAKGNVVAAYIDRSTVTGNHIILDQHIFESNVTAFDGIEMLGEESTIVGGHIHTYGTIRVHTLGSDATPETIINIGLSIKELDEKGALAGECTSLNKQMHDFVKQIENQKNALLQKQKAGMTIPESMKQQLINTQNKAAAFTKDAQIKLVEKSARLKILEERYAKSTKVRIEVKDITYPGVSFIFGANHLDVPKEEHHKHFFLQGSKITY